ncbi:hypothetical protein NL676_032315 [Syzygium grande]|nr:hypothetical protein NL676_032315 [Syzygium grande]
MGVVVGDMTLHAPLRATPSQGARRNPRHDTSYNEGCNLLHHVTSTRFSQTAHGMNINENTQKGKGEAQNITIYRHKQVTVNPGLDSAATVGVRLPDLTLSRRAKSKATARPFDESKSLNSTMLCSSFWIIEIMIPNLD